MSSKKGMYGQLKHIVKGKNPSKFKQLTSRQIDRHLNKITTSVVDDGRLLGIDRFTRKGVVITDKDANLHTLAIGTTGCCKTTVLCNII